MRAMRPWSLLAIVLVMACRVAPASGPGEPGAAAEAPPMPTGPVISVTGALAPMIMWTGAPARSLRVVEVMPGTGDEVAVRWALDAGAGELHAPVRFGEVPEGASEAAPAAELSVGTTYLIEVAGEGVGRVWYRPAKKGAGEVWARWEDVTP